MTHSMVEASAAHVSGSGEGHVVFVHGYGCDQHMWQFVEPIVRARYSTVLYDLIGCGHSKIDHYEPNRYSDLNAYSFDLVQLIEELALQGPIHLVGHSVGSTIAMLAAIQAPERFVSLTLVAPSPRYINDDGYVGGMEMQQALDMLDFLELNYEGWAAALAPVIMGNAEKPELSGQLKASFCRTEPAIAANFARATFLSDHRHDLSKLHLPVLVQQVAADAIAPIAVGEFIAAHIEGASLAMLDCEGHCPHVSNPDLVASSLLTFLSKVRQ